ncbi:hypothetical protein RHMOL_Rhmol05G0161300 [Rhododendron molle]|uniref:Uncharacterized protein n=1 Tax=Rhododendron molle TaxID=49168 RepID=A0ACC0NS03_RHOML|nr:hypothetical protein RHMOL_Rhmol05G0161300 [Rhododendron molle]
MQRNPSQRLVRLQPQSVTTEDSPLSSLAVLRASSTSIFEEPVTPAPSLAASTPGNPNMAGTLPHQPLTVEDMLMNLQNSITAMQQRSAQTDANITRLNDLINTRLPPPLEEEGEDDEDDQKQPIVVPDPNHEGRLIGQHNPRDGAFVLTASISDLSHQPIPAVWLNSASSLDILYFTATDPNPFLTLTN